MVTINAEAKLFGIPYAGTVFDLTGATASHLAVGDGPIKLLAPIIYPVKDIARAKKLYSKFLGVDPIMNEPYYVGFNVGDQHIGLVPNGHSQGMTGPVCHCHVKDIRRSLQSLLDVRAQMQQDVKDVGGGELIAWVRDADSNIIGLIQPAKD